METPFLKNGNLILNDLIDRLGCRRVVNSKLSKQNGALNSFLIGALLDDNREFFTIDNVAGVFGYL